jgi:hypothetical protein
LRAEGVFVEADCGCVAGLIIDGEDVEAAGVGVDVTFGDEALRRADYEALFVGGNAEFGKRGELFAERASADFDEGQRFAVVAHEIEFALYASWHVITRNEDVAVAAKVPVGVGFAPNAGTAGGMFALGEGIVVIFAEAFAGSPVDKLEDGAGDYRHGENYRMVIAPKEE